MFKLCVLTRWDFNFCIRSSPLRGSCIKASSKSVTLSPNTFHRYKKKKKSGGVWHLNMFCQRCIFKQEDIHTVTSTVEHKDSTILPTAGLLHKGFIKKRDSKPKYISPIPKKSGGVWHLNMFCQSCMFKQEDIHTVTSIVERKDSLTFYWPQGWFLSHKVHEEKDKPFLSLQFQGCYYYCVLLPFGFCLCSYFF